MSLADRFPQLSYDVDLPAADLLVIATRDDHIESTAARLAPFAGKSVGPCTCPASNRSRRWRRSRRLGIATGSFHPLQSLSDPETGARRWPEPGPG